MARLAEVTRLSRLLLQPLILVWLCGLHHATATKLNGNVELGDLGQIFLTKFCFDFKKRENGAIKAPAVGHVALQTNCKGCDQVVNNGDLWLVVYDDEEQSWPQIRTTFDEHTDLTCSLLKDYKPGGPMSGPVKYGVHMKMDGSPEHHYTFDISQEMRARYWYFTMVYCGPASSPNSYGPRGVTLDYKIHITNVNYSLQKEFSFDKIGMIALYTIFSVLFGVPCMLLGQDYLRTLYNERHKSVQDNPYLRPMLVAFLASEASCCAFFLFYCWFAYTGFETRFLYATATFWAVGANSMIYVMVSLASVGYGLTVDNRMSGFRVFALLIVAVAMLSAWLELSTLWYQDQSAYLYAYQSKTGFVAMLLKMLMFVLFMCQLVQSYKTELNERLRQFYWLLGCCFGAWFINVPVMVCLAYALAHEWRFRVVTIIEITVRFLGQIMFAIFFCGPLSPFYTIGQVLDVPTNMGSGVVQDVPNQIGLSLKEDLY